MKTLLVCLMTACSFHAVSQGYVLTASARKHQAYSIDQKLIVNSYIPGEKMKKAGMGLTIGSIPVLIGGIALLSTADEYYYNAGTSTNGGSYEEGDPKGAFGVVLTAAGVGMLVPGLILWSKGNAKMKAYKAKQVSLVPGSRSLTLSYRF